MTRSPTSPHPAWALRAVPRILGLLTGDVRARHAAGSLSTEHTARLWRFVPTAVGALLQAGPDLVGTLVPTEPLLAIAREAAPDGAAWLTRLARQVEERRRASGPPARPPDTFAQYARVLEQAARVRPLVVVLDDFQWADAGSIGLLAFLAERVTGSRILPVGAYRPSEVALGRDGERHPLAPVAVALARRFGEAPIELGELSMRSFVHALLDSEPNRLGEEFRAALHARTGAHPLFTVELPCRPPAPARPRPAQCRLPPAHHDRNLPPA